MTSCKFAAFRHLWVVTLLLLTSQTTEAAYQLYSVWSSGMTGNVCTPVSTPVTCGWKILVTFSPAIDGLEVWDATVTEKTHEGDSVTFQIENKPYNAVLAPSKDFCLFFNAFTRSQTFSVVSSRFLSTCPPSAPADLPPKVNPPEPDRKQKSGETTTASLAETAPKGSPSRPATDVGRDKVYVSTPWFASERPPANPAARESPTERADEPAPESTTPAVSQGRGGVTPTEGNQWQSVLPTMADPRQSVSEKQRQLEDGESEGNATNAEVDTDGNREVNVTSRANDDVGGGETPTRGGGERRRQGGGAGERQDEEAAGAESGAGAGPLPSPPTPTPPRSQPFTADADDYGRALELSNLFYAAQRSGALPPNNPLDWRGDSALEDRGERGEDLTGGWYNSGGGVKYNFPMAASTTLLLWGVLRWPKAYREAGQMDNVLDTVRWPLEYFLKCWNPQEQELYVQVGDSLNENTWWGRPEDMTFARPALKVNSSHPGSDVAAEIAAALAAGSLAFKDRDANFSDRLLRAARELYDFADEFRGKYSDTLPTDGFYDSWSGFQDELCWGAAWLYLATNTARYRRQAQTLIYGSTNELSWDNKLIACQMLMYELARNTRLNASSSQQRAVGSEGAGRGGVGVGVGGVEDTDESYLRLRIVSFLDYWQPGAGVTYTPCGLAWRTRWGPLRYAANTALLALVAAENGLQPEKQRRLAERQINYMLGDNPDRISFLVGFGDTYPLSPHHRASSCPSPPELCDWQDFASNSSNPHTLLGALVGGPDADDTYVDSREDYISNRVTCDYNAGFQSAVAGLLSLALSNDLPVVEPMCS